MPDDSYSIVCWRSEDGILCHGHIHPTSPHFSCFWLGCSSIKYNSFFLRRKLFFPFLYLTETPEGKLFEKEGCNSKKGCLLTLFLLLRTSSWKFRSEWPHLKGHSSTFHCWWEWNSPAFLGLSQNCCCYKLCGEAILGICRGMSNALCSWHTCSYMRAPHVHVAECDCTQQVGLPHFPPPLHSAPRPRLANGKG